MISQHLANTEPRISQQEQHEEDDWVSHQYAYFLSLKSILVITLDPVVVATQKYALGETQVLE